MKQSKLEKKTKKIEKRLSDLESENKELKIAVSVLTESLVVAAKSLEEITFVQKKHLMETESLMIVVNDINSLLNPKNDYLKYDLLNEPHN